MKKHIVIMLIMPIMIVMLATGCGKTASNPLSLLSDVSSSKNEIDTSEFENIGNDPNNIRSAGGYVAFDEEYVYYSGGGKGKIYRMNYDGGNQSVIVDSGFGGVNLNVYDGYLYYSISSSTSKIQRVNLSDFNDETIAEFNSDSNYNIVIDSMLVYDGILFYNIRYAGDNYSKVCAIDLNTLNNYELYQFNNSDWETSFSAFKDKMCCFVDTSKSSLMSGIDIYEVDCSEFKNNPEQTSFNRIYDDDHYDMQQLIFAKNGIIKTLPRYNMSDMNYEEYLYKDIKEDSYYWTPCTVKEFGEDPFIKKLINGYRYILGDNIFVITGDIDEYERAGTSDKLALFSFNKDDLNNVNHLGQLGNYLQVVVGAWNGKLYCIDVELQKLIVVDSTGSKSEYNIN